MADLLSNASCEAISLSEWVLTHSSEEELRTTFLNLDRTLKYIHEHGYCIEVFHPSEIFILDNKSDHIQFKKLIQLSSNMELHRQMIQEDIYNSAFIQIGIYSKCLKYLTPSFLNENFDSFIIFLPTGDVPYYRGVIQRNASVYFCEYALEKRNRDLTDLTSQVGDSDSSKALVKHVSSDVITNDRVNDIIYKQINGLSDTAFVHFLLIPTIVFCLLMLFSIIIWISGFFLL